MFFTFRGTLDKSTLPPSFIFYKLLQAPDN